MRQPHRLRKQVAETKERPLEPGREKGKGELPGVGGKQRGKKKGTGVLPKEH